MTCLLSQRNRPPFVQVVVTESDTLHNGNLGPLPQRRLLDGPDALRADLRLQDSPLELRNLTVVGHNQAPEMR